MKKRSKFFLLRSLIVVLLLCNLICVSCQESDEGITISKVIRLDDYTLFAAGQAADAPLLIKSLDKGKTWQEVVVKSKPIMSPKTNYSLGHIENTLWVIEQESCVSCDFSNSNKGAYFSHNNGMSWTQLDMKKFKVGTNFSLSFFNDKDAELVHFESDNAIALHTNDGGNTWSEGRLEKSKKNKKNSFATVKRTGDNLEILDNDGTWNQTGSVPKTLDDLN